MGLNALYLGVRLLANNPNQLCKLSAVAPLSMLLFYPSDVGWAVFEGVVPMLQCTMGDDAGKVGVGDHSGIHGAGLTPGILWSLSACGVSHYRPLHGPAIVLSPPPSASPSLRNNKGYV